MYKLKKIRPHITKILLVVFAGLTVVSAVNLYSAHNMPLYNTQRTTLFSYRHTGTFNYTAVLKPNMIYNKTILRPGEGILYEAIVDHVVLSYSHEFDGFPDPMNVSTDQRLTVKVESPEKWTRTLTDEEAEDLLRLTGSERYNMLINHTRIQEIVDQINKETGVRSSSYNLRILPSVSVRATTQYGTVEDTFQQELVVAFILGGDKGSYISLEELQKTKSDEITREREVLVEEVEDIRRESILFVTLSSVVLGFTAYMYVRERPEAPPRREIRRIIDPYRDLITETSETPPETGKTINMNSMEDLAKTAEILARPIIHVEMEGQHVFYIIDSETKYQFKIIE